MLDFLMRRMLLMIPTLFIVSGISFFVIQAPPGDFVTAHVQRLEDRGQIVDREAIEAMRARYGLDQPAHVQYVRWIRSMFRGDLGMSFDWGAPVSRVIARRIPNSLIISLFSFLFVYAVAIPIGMLSATRQYSVADYFFTFVAFVGLGIPNFLFALVMLWVVYSMTGQVLIGLFSAEYVDAAWSWARFMDMLRHVWIPAIIVGTAGTAKIVRVMRASLLDELQKPYVMVARAKGLSRSHVNYKYPFRIAINPVVSTIGWTLPSLITGEMLVSLVLGLPTLAPIFLRALQMQDMYLAGGIVFVLTLLTLLGTLISDILLGWIDPRIRFSSM
ncbi:MAG: ABC transporter permease [Spirochaetaceae bacterium]|nr:MAG: ABC transporter permease [Spirochaetaceae bacterium]